MDANNFIVLSSDDEEMSNDDTLYEMQKIEDVRFARNRIEYLIIFTNQMTSWEPVSSLEGDAALRALEDFRRENKDKIEELLINQEEYEPNSPMYEPNSDDDFGFDSSSTTLSTPEYVPMSPEWHPNSEQASEQTFYASEGSENNEDDE